MRRAAFVLVLTLIFAPLLGKAGDDTQRAWQALRAGGHIMLLRHAAAPGVGDPPEFRLADCTTQRNLSAEGRAQARLFGATIRRQDVQVEGVYASQWCRCLQTAELIGLGPVTALPSLNSLFGRDPAQQERQTAELRAWLADRRPRGSLVLVTHQVNITALTGIFPASGEAIVVKPLTSGEVDIIGRIPPP